MHAAAEESKKRSVERYCVALAWHGCTAQSIRCTTVDWAEDWCAIIDPQQLKPFEYPSTATSRASRVGRLPGRHAPGRQIRGRTRTNGGALWTDCRRSSLCDGRLLAEEMLKTERRGKRNTAMPNDFSCISRGCCSRCNTRAVVITIDAFVWLHLTSLRQTALSDNGVLVLSCVKSSCTFELWSRFHSVVCRVLSLSDRRYSLNPLSQTRIDWVGRYRIRLTFKLSCVWH